MSERPLLSESSPTITRVNRLNEHAQPEGAIVATDDPEVIRAWARQHAAEPATGEDTYSGPATVDVQDGGVGIRFNFPGVGKFRSISWDEWFSNFRQFDLLFVYQRDTTGDSQNARYRIVSRTDFARMNQSSARTSSSG